MQVPVGLPISYTLVWIAARPTVTDSKNLQSATQSEVPSSNAAAAMQLLPEGYVGEVRTRVVVCL